MVEIFDEQGNTIEAFDADNNPIDVFGKTEVDEKVDEVKTELEEKAETAKTEYEEKVVKKDEEIEKIKKDIEEGEGGDKGKNLSALRQAKDKAEEDKEKISGEFETFKKEMNEKVEGIHSAVSNKKIDDAIVKTVGDDKEMQDKVRIHFNRIKPLDTADPEKIEEDFGIRMKQAHILAGGGGIANAVGNVAATEGGYIPSPAGEATAESPTGDLADMMKRKMGITDKEIRDHKKVKNL